MNKVKTNLTARMIVAALSIASFGSSIALADTKQDRFYVSADYGFANVKTQATQTANTLAFNHNVFVTHVVNYQKPSQKDTFFSIGAGREFGLSSIFSVRLGAEYNYLVAKNNGNYSAIAKEDDLGNEAGTYQFNQASQAFFASSKLLVQPWQALELSFYAGVKAGLAINSISNYSSNSGDGFQLNYANTTGVTKSFAYGWNVGTEYQLFNHLGIHAGFEQINLGKSPSLTQGSWSIPNYTHGSAANLNPGNLSVNIVNVGLTYLF